MCYRIHACAADLQVVVWSNLKWQYYIHRRYQFQNVVVFVEYSYLIGAEFVLTDIPSSTQLCLISFPHLLKANHPNGHEHCHHSRARVVEHSGHQRVRALVARGHERAKRLLACATEDELNVVHNCLFDIVCFRVFCTC